MLYKKIFYLLAITFISGMVWAAEDLYYAVDDQGLNNSQFFTISPDLSVNRLGSVRKGADIEGFDVDQSDGKIYVSSGDDTDNPGYLYRLDPVNGSLIRIGAIQTDTHHFKEVDGLSFRPSDYTLWGWAQGEGLLTIDKTTGKATLVIGYNGEIEDLTWDNEGKILYAVENIHETNAFDSEPDKNGAVLWAYDGNNAKEVCRKIVKDLPEIEALETLANNELLFGFHQSKKLLIYTINPTTCGITQQGEIDIKYSDIEGISLVPSEKSYAAKIEAFEKLREEAAKIPLPPQPPLDRSRDGMEYEYEPIEYLPISQYFTSEDPIAAAVDYVKTYLFTEKERDYYTIDSFDSRYHISYDDYVISLKQKYQNIPVYGSSLVVIMDRTSGKLSSMRGSVVPVFIDESLFPKINTDPNPFIQHSAHPEDQPEPLIYINAQLLDLDMNILIDVEKAKQLIKEKESTFYEIPISEVIVTDPLELMIFNQGMYKYGFYKSILVWKVPIFVNIELKDVLIDVQTGEIVYSTTTIINGSDSF
ncbi:MAG: hypothetical protein QM487_02900 [Candidatus Marithrix sp.]